METLLRKMDKSTKIGLINKKKLSEILNVTRPTLYNLWKGDVTNVKFKLVMELCLIYKVCPIKTLFEIKQKEGESMDGIVDYDVWKLESPNYEEIETKDDIVDRAIDQLRLDLANGDVTAIDQLLQELSEADLKNYLGED